MQLTGLLNRLRQSPAYAVLLERLRRMSTVPDQHLLRSARAYVIAALADDLNRPTLILTGRIERAHDIVEQLPVWLPSHLIQRFAEPAAIFYERAAWTTATIQNRLRVLATLAPPVTLRQSTESPTSVVVSSAFALMQRTLPIREFRAGCRVLRVGTQATPDSLLRGWMQSGYAPASIVTEPGTFSRRGGILDVFPVAADEPMRIEFFGDEIESIRTFSPGTQRSTANIDHVTITPAREALPRLAPQVAERLGQWFAARPSPAEDATSALPDHESLSSAIAFPFLEFYLPYLYTHAPSLLDYVPEEALVIVDDWGALQDSVAELEEQALSIRQERLSTGHLPSDYALPYLTWAELQDELSTRRVLHLGSAMDYPHSDAEAVGELFGPGPRFGGQLRLMLEDLKRWSNRGEAVVVVTQQAQRIAELWGDQEPYQAPVSQITTEDAPHPVTFVEGSLAEGWTLSTPKGSFHLLSDAELFGWKRPEPRRRLQPRAMPPESGFADLEAGDFVVHFEYGIGRFAGLQKRTLDNSEREYLVIEYANNDLLYVPIHQADRVSRYVGADDRPPQLNRLGTQEWHRTKETTRKAVEEIARDLLDLYAARSQVIGHASGPDTPWQNELEASFPYVETEDQLRALQAVKADMERPLPMDRLICGDVGYGKTEVALRAAFKAVMGGRQVAVLVPTTVLAQQHFNTFSRRLLTFPVKVEMLSRFRSPAEQRAILYELAHGQVDIVIGTHRLLQPDVIFKDLGLLVIDEEQRFGVTHKEYLKRLRTEVDVLTMTATPIPRTLHMGLTGIRDISMIMTPPEERLPIVTHVGTYSDGLVRQAILREIDRGGQVFFVHNRVQTIGAVADRLRRLLPEARIAVGHGQLDEAELEQVMIAFARGDYDVLLSTSIIESGLDIPNANTLIVDRADWFGLAQLYQLRGRVGRGANQAYAYFFHPRSMRLTAEARARLDTIGEETRLGAGMSIALRDLEIRGAGDLLGTRQSGHIAAVGFHLYTQLLADSVKHLKGAQTATPLLSPAATLTIDLPIPAYIPTTFIAEPSLRIQLYRRLAELADMTGIDEIEQELRDRFGTLPRAVRGLIFQLRVKILASGTSATAIATEGDQIAVRLPYLATIDRSLLQQQLGPGVRVSRTAVWLPFFGQEDAVWQAALLSLLLQLNAAEVHASSAAPHPQAPAV